MTGVMFPRQLPPGGAGRTRTPDLEDLGMLHLETEERFDRIAVLARQVFDVAAAGIAMRSGTDAFMKAGVGLGPMGCPEIEDLARFAMKHPGVKIIEDALGFAEVGLIARRQPIRFYAGYPVTSPSGGHIGTLFVVDQRRRTFSERDEKLLGELKWWVDRELRHSAELDQAAEVQRKLMPEYMPQVTGYEFAAACVPCRGVGGDFFDWYTTDRGVVMALGDVMGKGIGAAMLMAVTCSVLRAAGRQYPPAAAVEFADLALREELESTGTLITVCHGELYPETGVVRYVDAGHGLMFSMLADGTVRRAPTELGSLPLGVLPGEKRSEIVIQLQPGDVAFIFSDGLLDLYDGTVASIDVIAREVRALGDQGAQAIVSHFAQRAGNSVLTDDVTVTAYRRSPS